MFHSLKRNFVALILKSHFFFSFFAMYCTVYIHKNVKYNFSKSTVILKCSCLHVILNTFVIPVQCAIMPKNNSAYKESFAVCGCAKNVFWQCTKSRTRTKCPSITVIWDPLLPGHGRPVWEELDGVRWRELCVRQDRPPRVHHRLSVQVSVLYLGVLGLGSVPFHVKKYSRNIYKIVCTELIPG